MEAPLLLEGRPMHYCLYQDATAETAAMAGGKVAYTRMLVHSFGALVI
jgi:hypothetical protein